MPLSRMVDNDEMMVSGPSLRSPCRRYLGGLEVEDDGKADEAGSWAYNRERTSAPETRRPRRLRPASIPLLVATQSAWGRLG